MKVLMMKLWLAYNRMPFRVRVRFSMMMADKRVGGTVRQRTPSIIARVRWFFAIGRAPPD